MFNEILNRHCDLDHEHSNLIFLQNIVCGFGGFCFCFFGHFYSLLLQTQSITMWLKSPTDAFSKFFYCINMKKRLQNTLTHSVHAQGSAI